MDYYVISTFLYDWECRTILMIQRNRLTRQIPMQGILQPDHMVNGEVLRRIWNRRKILLILADNSGTYEKSVDITFNTQKRH